MQNQTKKEITFAAFFTAEVLLLLLVFVGSFSLFLYLTREVFVLNNQQFDNWAFEKVKQLSSDSLTGWMKFITFFGSKNFFIAVPLVLTFFFLLFKKWRWFSTYIFISTLGSVLLNQYFKNNFSRPRPETALFEQSGFSFPSGHAMIGATFYGILIYLIWKNVTKKWLKWGSIIFLACWQLLIAFSRVYLNVHYATDVLAGLAAGIFWLFLAILGLRHLEARYRRSVEEK